MQTRILYYILFLFLIMLMFSGCGNNTADNRTQNSGPQNEKNKIIFWHSFDKEGQVIAELIAEFKNANRDVEIDSRYMPLDSIEKKYLDAMQSGQAPDVLRINGDWLAFMANRGYIDKLPSEGIFEWEDYLSIAKQGSTYNNDFYGVPQEIFETVLFYNLRQFKNAELMPPSSLKELINAGQKNFFDGKDAYHFAFAAGDAHFVEQFLFAFSGGIWDKNHNVRVATKENLSAVEYIFSLVNKRVMPPLALTDSYSSVINGFKNGKYAVIMAYSWSLSDIMQGAEFRNTANLGTVRLFSTERPVTVYNYDYVVSSAAKNKTSAYKFLNFINSREAQKKLLASNGHIPTRIGVADSSSVSNEDKGKIHSLSDGKISLVTADKLQIYAVFNSQLTNAAEGKMKIEDAFIKIDEFWQRIAKKQTDRR